MHQNKQYDYIVTGGGCAGLSFIMHVLNEPQLADKRILLIEKELKNQNDRTWCYWERGEGFFEDILFRKWNQAWFHGPGYSSKKSLSPYAYKMIRGVDFYQHCFQKIKDSKQVDVVYEEVVSVEGGEEVAHVQTNSCSYSCKYVFNSILFGIPQLGKNNYYLLQHFKGWIIETDDDAFSMEEPTLMDFRVDQQYGTTFVYVMPLEKNRALVEYTLFTKELLKGEEYDAGLRAYIQDYLGIKEYRIAEEEFGIIPMTDFKFSATHKNIVNMGTAGGFTKPSSGYTFRYIQKHAMKLVSSLKENGHPHVTESRMQRRFRWYDQTLLHMLHFDKMPGSKIFTLLFKHNRIQSIFRFLDNETSVGEEVFLLNSLPQIPFMKAGWHELMKSE